MNTFELIASLSPKERMDMMMKGFRPGDIKDIKRYRSGERASLQEREQKAKILAGEFKNLGGATEREIMLDSSRQSIPLEEVEQKIQSKAPAVQRERNVRKQLMEDMSGYENAVGKTFTTDDILSFRERKESIRQPSGGVENIINEGFGNAKEYLNAFVLNLQNENKANSYTLRLNIFKALKKCLESEGKYKGNSAALNAYRSGVIKAEKALLNKLSGE